MVKYHKAFTLVELLVVIAIIAVLIALLMPALSEARQNANRSVCLSNIRQLAIAFIMYANDNRGYFPNSSASNNENPSDWIYYQSNRVLSQSAIVQYVGGTFNPSVFRCPSDDWTYRPRVNFVTWPYSYSYSMNLLMSSDTSEGLSTIFQYGTIPNPDQKLLLDCEDAATLDDGRRPRRVRPAFLDADAVPLRPDGSAIMAAPRFSARIRAQARCVYAEWWIGFAVRRVGGAHCGGGRGGGGRYRVSV
jgi:prepilin-type N-terminal cleavage/methylation domain-containing protein